MKLPEELVLAVFSHLAPQQLLRSLSTVSKTYYRLAMDNLSWYQRLKKFRLGEESSKPYDRTVSYVKIFITHFNNRYHAFTELEKKFISFAQMADVAQLTALGLKAEETAAIIKKWIEHLPQDFRQLPSTTLDHLYQQIASQLDKTEPYSEFAEYSHLTWAIVFNQRALIQTWLTKSFIILDRLNTHDHESPSCLIALLDRVELMQDFLQHRLKIDTDSHVSASTSLPLHQAAFANSLRVADLLLRTEPRLAKIEDRTGTIALHLASAKGHAAMITLLLSTAPDTVNAKTSREETPLSFAALNDQVSAIQTLLDHKADIEALDKEQRTPLFIAVQNDSQKAAACLIARGANTNACDAAGHPVLEKALMHRNETLATLLRAKGAQESPRTLQLGFWNQQHAKSRSRSVESRESVGMGLK